MLARQGRGGRKERRPVEGRPRIAVNGKPVKKQKKKGWNRKTPHEGGLQSFWESRAAGKEGRARGWVETWMSCFTDQTASSQGRLQATVRGKRKEKEKETKKRQKERRKKKEKGKEKRNKPVCLLSCLPLERRPRASEFKAQKIKTKKRDQVLPTQHKAPAQTSSSPTPPSHPGKAGTEPDRGGARPALSVATHFFSALM